MKVSVALIAVMLASTAARPALAQLQPAPQVGARSRAQKRASKHTSDSVHAESAGDRPQALASAKAAIAADPNDAWGYYLLGDALVFMGRTDDAVASYEQAERTAPQSDPWAKSVAIWGAAHAFEEASRCADAAPLYQRDAALTAPLDASAAALAREHAERQCAPPAPPALTPQEVTSADDQITGKYTQALQLADDAIRENPEDGWAHYMRADALTSLRRFDAAVASFQTAQRLFPESKPYETSIAIWGEANALKEAGRCKQASPVYRRYAAFMAQRDPNAAALAREYAKKQCVPIITTR
jgi:tetratricopeptide (TPR) repeat protein